MEAAARAQPSPAGPVYTRRPPEKSALYQVMQQHLLTFEQEWTDEASGRTLPKFVTEELHKYLDCGILARGFAHLYCDACRQHHVHLVVGEQAQVLQHVGPQIVGLVDDEDGPAASLGTQASDLVLDLAVERRPTALGGQAHLPGDGLVQIHQVAGGQRDVDDAV